jgi:HEAT repeat protein
MWRTAFLLILLGGGAQQAPPPTIQNGRVDTRQATSIEREVATAKTQSADPVWVGWRVPVADGQRGGCSTYTNDNIFRVGEYLEGQYSNTPSIAPPAGPVSIEGGSGVVMLVRLLDGRIDRLRVVGDDCPLDAGGRTVFWLQGVAPADSLKYLETLLKPVDTMTPAQEQRVSQSAVSAIALHRDPAADAILDRLATADSDTSLRRAALSSLGSNRGAHGFETIKKLIDSDRFVDARRQLVSALGQTRQPGTADALLAIARKDFDAKTRAEAVYWAPMRGGPRTVPEVTAIIASDTSDEVKQRAVKGLARLPGEDSVPLMLQLARTSTVPVVRKEAVTALGQSKDPRAIAYMEAILK